VDGDGGSPTVAISRTTTAGEILRGAASFEITVDAANRQGEGVAYAFAVDQQDEQSVLSLSFDYRTQDANYAADDLAVYLYDVDNGALITPSVTGIGIAQNGRFQATFVTTDSTNYRLIFHVASTNATGYTMQFDNVKVGPELAVQGVPQTDWTSFTVSSTISTDVTHTGFYKRVGDTMKGVITSDFTGTSTESGSVDYTIPNSLTIDTSILNTTNDNPVVGQTRAEDSSAGSRYNGVAIMLNSTTIRPRYFTDTGTSEADGTYNFGTGTPFAEASGDRLVTTFEVPIAEWAGSSVNLSVATAEYASNSDTSDANDTSSFQYGPSGQEADYSFGAARDKRVRFLTSIQPTDNIVFEISEDRVDWHKIPFLLSSSAGIDNRSGNVGVSLKKVSGSDTDVDVAWGQYRTGTTAWTNNTFYWRVVKYPGVIQSAQADLAAPEAMDAATATRLGHYVYEHGTTYAGGNAPTVTANAGLTGSLSSVNFNQFIPYQMSDGSWRMKFTLNVSLSGDSRSSAELDLNGVTAAAHTAELDGFAEGATTTYYAWWPKNGNTMNIDLGAARTTAEYHFAGDIALASKPTWAY
jgi:hypothetical protein